MADIFSYYEEMTKMSQRKQTATYIVVKKMKGNVRHARLAPCSTLREVSLCHLLLLRFMLVGGRRNDAALGN